MIKIWNETFWKAAPEQAESAMEQWRAEPRTRLLMMTPIVSLAAITLTIGLFAEPFVDYSMRAGVQLLDKSVYIDAVFGPSVEVSQ